MCSLASSLALRGGQQAPPQLQRLAIAVRRLLQLALHVPQLPNLVQRHRQRLLGLLGGRGMDAALVGVWC